MFILVPLALQLINIVTSNVWCILIICATVVLLVGLLFPPAGERLKQIVREITLLIRELTRLIMVWSTDAGREKEQSATQELPERLNNQSEPSRQQDKNQRDFSYQEGYGPQQFHQHNSAEQTVKTPQTRKKESAYEPELPHRRVSSNTRQSEDRSGHSSRHSSEISKRSMRQVQRRSKKQRNAE